MHWCEAFLGKVKARISKHRYRGLTPLAEDLYIFPKSLEWTMVFTYEQPNLGPYFHRRDR
jgi:hypothetical protein